MINKYKHSMTQWNDNIYMVDKKVLCIVYRNKAQANFFFTFLRSTIRSFCNAF
jgi:hypothetical protein